MSWIEDGLFTHIRNTTTPAGGVWPMVRPQNGVMPAITYARTGGPRQYTLDGQVLARGTFDIHCYGANYAETKDVAEAVRLALSGYAETQAGKCVKVHFIHNEIDHYEEETRTYVCLLDVEIHYNETV